jgi:hypothetical protein
MVSRTMYLKESGDPVVFSHDFLRSDYARIHSEIQIDEPVLPAQKGELRKEAAAHPANNP